MATSASPIMVRRRPPKGEAARLAIEYPHLVDADFCRRKFFYFLQCFWECISDEEPIWNWHIEFICQELEVMAKRVAEKQEKDYDLIINIPPGTTKSIICSIMFPIWCWINWPWMRFICGSYSKDLALENADYCREIIKHKKFIKWFPYLQVKEDKDTKHNFRIEFTATATDGTQYWKMGGNRFSTSVGSAVTGFHAHFIIVDDPLDPEEAISEKKLNRANRWMGHTLSTRKISKANTPTLLIMQRLHQNDPTGHLIEERKGKKVKHICLPGEINSAGYKELVKPVEKILEYKKRNGLLDPIRMPSPVLEELELIGQYFYSGQIGQNPTPPGGGMFQVDHFRIIPTPLSEVNIVRRIRYWDKAATEGGDGARTAGVRMALLRNGKFLIEDCVSGRWGSDERENIQAETAEADGPEVVQIFEQEPGSGGKDSALASIRNVAGSPAAADRPTGKKEIRADPYSAQVNHGNVWMLLGDWNHDFIEEHRFFPFGTTKDKVDAASGAFNKLAKKKVVRDLLSGLGKRKSA